MATDRKLAVKSRERIDRRAMTDNARPEIIASCQARIAVIIPAFNAQATLARTVESLRAQSFTAWEAVIIDDGSIDDTRGMALRFAASDDRIRIVSQANGGLSTARNRGIETTGAPYCLFLDSDDTIAPDHLRNLINAMGRGENRRVSYSGYQRVDDEGVVIQTRFDRGLASAAFWTFAFRNPLAVHCALVPRSAFAEIGTFDSVLPCCEDWDLWQRLARAGFAFVGVEEPSAIYWTASQSMSRDFGALMRAAWTVIERASGSDVRVLAPTADHTAGVGEANFAARVYFFLWAAVAGAAANGRVPVSLEEMPAADLGGKATELVGTILDALTIGGYALPPARARLWNAVRGVILPILDKVERTATEQGLCHRVLYQLERDLVRADPLDTALSLCTIHAERIDMNNIRPIRTDADLLHLRFATPNNGSKRVELPCWGELAAIDIARLAIETLGHQAVMAQLRWRSLLPAVPRWLVRLARRRATVHPAQWKQDLWYCRMKPSPRDRRAAIDARVRANVAALEAVPVAPIAATSHFPPGDYSRTYWENFFDKDDPWQLGDPFEQRKYTLALSLLEGRRIGRALEVGCAEGHFTERLAPHVGSLTAADISVTALERARARLSETPETHFIQLDLAADPLPRDFDLVVCGEMLFYLGDTDRIKTGLRNLRDSVRPSGLLLLTHSLLIEDNPDRTGFDWGMQFGADGLAVLCREISGLSLERSIRTDLYGIDLWRRTTEEAAAPIPAVEKANAGLPRPEIYRTIRWGGIVARAEQLCEMITTRSVPTLMYHMVAPKGPPALDRYRVHPDQLEGHLRALRRHGFYGITSAEFDWYRLEDKALPGRPILLTFDDGYLDFFTHAWPVLYRNDFRAEVFIVTGKVGGASDWDRHLGEPQRLMDWSQIAELNANGIRFGSHLVSHRYADAMTTPELFEEALQARLEIERRIGCEVRSLAPPSGGIDERSIRIFNVAGYHCCFTTRDGIAKLDDHALNLPRIEMTPQTDIMDVLTRLLAG